MNFNKETIYNLGIGGASEIRLRELIHQLRADWIEMNEELTRLKKAHSASPNANTVLCGVAAIDDLKCCGNCINSRHYTNLVIPESIFCCAVSAHRIKPHNMCEYWKQDNYESEQRNIDKPKP